MIPKILQENGKENISKILEKFYLMRPKHYCLMDREQDDYNSYVDIIYSNIDRDNPSILDLGSGSHRIPLTIANRLKEFESIISLDYYSPEKINEFSNYIKDDRIQLVSYSDKSFPLPESSFDVVSSLCVFEHIIDANFSLNEIKRVLKPKGILIISAPNWSGISAVIRSLISIIFKKDRYWRYENLGDSLIAFFRVWIWYFSVLFSINPKFLYIEPRISDNEINFERSDDDVVHLCQPLSFKRWLKKNGFQIIRYNRFQGETKSAKIFNTLFPSFATVNQIIAKKI